MLGKHCLIQKECFNSKLDIINHFIKCFCTQKKDDAEYKSRVLSEGHFSV